MYVKVLGAFHGGPRCLPKIQTGAGVFCTARVGRWSFKQAIGSVWQALAN